MVMETRMVTVATDLGHGGRWTSLRTGDREWLWSRSPATVLGAARDSVSPGDPFVDSGGLEECIPTVRGNPDHGSVWSRRWTVDGITVDDFTLSRAFRSSPGELTVDYLLRAEPGYAFVWAAHALL